MSKILNIGLMATLFISSTFAMKNNTNIDNLCPDIFQEILSYLVPKEFPDNKKAFKEKYYKNVANLRLVSKKLKNLINNKDNHNNLINSFEEHLFKIVKNKKYFTSKGKIDIAAKIGSKKYFQNIEHDNYDIIIDAFELAASKEYNYPDLTSIIFNKYILKVQIHDKGESKKIEESLKAIGKQEFIEKFEEISKKFSIKKKSLLFLIFFISGIWAIYTCDFENPQDFLISFFTPFISIFLFYNKYKNNLDDFENFFIKLFIQVYPLALITLAISCKKNTNISGI